MGILLVGISLLGISLSFTQFVGVENTNAYAGSYELVAALFIPCFWPTINSMFYIA